MFAGGVNDEVGPAQHGVHEWVLELGDGRAACGSRVPGRGQRPQPVLVAGKAVSVPGIIGYEEKALVVALKQVRRVALRDQNLDLIPARCRKRDPKTW